MLNSPKERARINLTLQKLSVSQKRQFLQFALGTRMAPGSESPTSTCPTCQLYDVWISIGPSKSQRITGLISRKVLRKDCGNIRKPCFILGKKCFFPSNWSNCLNLEISWGCKWATRHPPGLLSHEARTCTTQATSHVKKILQTGNGKRQNWLKGGKHTLYYRKSKP